MRRRVPSPAPALTQASDIVRHVRKVTLRAARSLAVARQLLSGPRPPAATDQEILEVVRRIGFLQLDPTAVVARNPLLVLFSRLGPFDPELLNRLILQKRLLYEGWAPMAAIVLTEDRGLNKALPAWWKASKQWFEANASLRDELLGRLAAGSLRASDLGDERPRDGGSGWYSGSWGPARHMLGLLDVVGLAVPAGRAGGARTWTLARDWFEDDPDPLPSARATRIAVARGLRELGVGTASQLRGNRRYASLATVWSELASTGEILPVDLGIKGEWFVHREDLPLLDEVEAGDFEGRTVLLSPFDPLISHRPRTLALWGFDFKLEIYVPKAKRWGYFVMPLLDSDQLVARFDLAIDRKSRTMNVLRVGWEADSPSRALRRRADQALAELASFAGADSVRSEQSQR